MPEIFDPWPEKYDQWFQTPLGRLIEGIESQLVLSLLEPGHGELLLDAGCGTGIFTAQLLDRDARVVGLELSRPMLVRALSKSNRRRFLPVHGDMRHLPFADGLFDKTVSVTAIEFIENAALAVEEMFRVTKAGGIVLVATLNSLSPWARRRREAAEKGHPLFRRAVFRSPEEIAGFSAVEGVIRTAIHFQKTDAPALAEKKEKEGKERGLNTGAFIAARWTKPGG